MIYRIFILSTVLFLLSVGCTQVQNANQNDEKLFQVVINSDVGQSIYYLDTDNKIKRNFIHNFINHFSICYIKNFRVTCPILPTLLV